MSTDSGMSVRPDASDSRGPSSPRGLRCWGLGGISRILLVAVAIGGTRIGIAESFPPKSTTSNTNRRLPLAVAIPSWQRERQWREDAKDDLWQGFDRGRRKRQATRTTRLNMFFNKRDEEGNIIKKEKKTRVIKPSANTLNELRSAGNTFPKEITLSNNIDDDVSLSLRYMTTEDLKSLVPMCIEEFGNLNESPHQKGSNKRRSLLPRWILDPKQIPDLWEGFSFEMLIYWTLKLKLMQGGNSRRSGLKQPKDPVMLVLCEEQDPDGDLRRLISWESDKTDENSKVVGMVELSLQPPDADRNPPAVPFPLWYKASLAERTTKDGSLQGWVTNLLIDNSCRGRGYSKILMAAAEGIAKHKWGCSSVYLHADADFRSGKVPQSLYEGLGYDLVIGSTKKNAEKPSEEDYKAKFGWMGVSGKEMERFSAVRMVDGVALLCYCKQL